MFYGALPVENRLKTMRQSDGICKLCGLDAENIEHMILKCNKLDGIWLKIGQFIKRVFGQHLSISFQDIALGICQETICEREVLHMLVFICKWQIWIRRNLFIFENEYKDSNWIWQIYKANVNKQIDIILQTKFIFGRKLKPIKAVLLNVRDELKNEV